MSDEVTRILSEHASSQEGKPDLDADVDVSEESFDETGYLRLNPDVAEGVRAGKISSGYRHYVAYGYREGRSVSGLPHEPRNRLIASANAGGVRVFGELRSSVERVLLSPGGGLMLIGWVDDARDLIESVRVSTPQWRVVIDGQQFVRVRRQDVEAALAAPPSHLYGYFGFLFFDRAMRVGGPCSVELRLRSGGAVTVEAPTGYCDDIELRNVLLTYLASSSFLGNQQVEGISCLEGGLGVEVVRFNRAITTRVLSTPYVERFGRKARRARASLIVCLYGKAEFQFLQSCLYAGLPGFEDHEFIFVSNSPELAETLLREARSASVVYGIDQTVVVLPGNAGFGGANNAAVRASLSNRIIALNPDVFPRDREWARKHTDLIGCLPASRTRLFGTSLYYDDGSLMHGGMYFDVDTGLSMAGGRPHPAPMVRVEHYGKGAPDWATTFTRARPVPAVTGAFISADRGWFEGLGGFTEDYVFGHYEDADLCLKSLAKGTPAWLHDLKMWHLEGKGSTRLPPHEGGSLVNRWLFSKTWLPTIQAGLIGQSPSHPAFDQSAAPVSSKPPVAAPMPPPTSATLMSPPAEGPTATARAIATRPKRPVSN